jgi:hypothetical protein
VYGWGRLVATHRGRPGGEDGGNLMPRSPRSRVSESQAAARRSAEEDYILYADYAARSTTSSMQTMPRGVLHTLSRLCREEYYILYPDYAVMKVPKPSAELV